MKLGSSKRKTTTKLSKTAPNNQWFKNVIKSAGYATADIIKDTIPSTFEFVESNGKDAIQLYNDLRQDGPKSVTKLLAQSMDKNAYMKIAKDAIANTREDLKSGKFYNKEREERAVLGDLAGDGTGDDEFDFSFDESEFDDFGDFEGGDSELDSDSNVTNVKKVTVNNINANITKNNPMVQSINKQSEIILASADATNKVNTALATTSFTLTSKVASDMMTGMSTINDNLTALVNFNNDSMSKYVAASLQYYSDSLAVLNSTLEHLKGPAQEEKPEKEQIDPFLSNGGLNIKSYAQLMKKNMTNVIQDDLLLNSIYSFASDTDTINMLAASPLKIIPKMISKVIVPTIVRESAAEFDKSFANFFPALLNKFNKMAESDNWFLSKVGKLFGFKPKNKTTVDISAYNKGDINFNGITQKAITEVIPTYLRKILSAINGKNEMIFDYQSGKFTDYMKAVKESEDTVRNRSLGAMETYSDLKSRLGAVRFTDENDKKAMYKDFDDFMFKLSKSNGINPHVRTVKGETVDELRDLYSGQFSEIFRSALLSLDKSDIMKLMGSDIFSAKSSVTKYFEDAQNNIGSSVLPVLEAWDSKDDYEKTKDGDFKRKDSLKSIPLDKYGKSSLDYLREVRNLLVEGIVVVPTKSMGHTAGARPNRNQRDSELYRSRRERLKEIQKENDALVNTTLSSNMSSIKTYTDKEKEKLRAKGIVVADSVSDLVTDSTSTTQLTDMFKTYSQLKEGDTQAAKDLGKAGNWVKKLFSKGGKKVEGMRDVFDNIFSLPGRLISNVFEELDNGLYKIIFGVNHDGSEQSFLSRVVTSIKSEFSGFFDWTKESFFTPLHDALLGDEGILTKLKNSQAMESLKKFGNKMADWAFGNLDENGHRRNGAFSDAFNDVKDMTNSVRNILTGREYTDRHGNVHERNQNSVMGSVNSVMGDIYENSRLYLFGNKKDRYKTSTMLVPQPIEQPVEQTPLSPTLALYSREAAQHAEEQKNRPVVMLDRPSTQTPMMSPNISPFVMSYQERNRTEGNGGENILDWVKNNLKLQYSIDVNGNKGETKTISVGENVEEDAGSGGISPMMVNGFPYYSQRDPRYAHTPYNLSTGKGGGDGLAFGDRGCGPTAMSMVATGLGKNVDPLSMADMATEEGYSVASGTKGSFFKSIGEKLGFRAKEKQTTETKVESAINQGKPIIFRGRKTSDKVTPFTSDGHFVVGVGGKNGKVQINDPNGVETSGEYDIKDIVSESNKMWTFDDTGKGAGDVFEPIPLNYKAVKYQKKKDKYITEWSKDASADNSGEIRGVVTELVEGVRYATADMITLIYGDEAGEQDREKRSKEFGTKFREALPKGIAGGILGGGLGTIVGATGGMGLLGSLFLPGGPVGAAILGSAIGFASQSNKFKDWLFGEKDPEDSTKRLGGFISAKTQKFVKDHKTTIVGGAALGGLKGVLSGAGVLPSLLFGGPLTGALMGAGIGLAVRSEKFQNLVFGKDDDVTGKKIGGILSKSYNSIADNKKKIGGAAVGLLGGAAVGAVASSMGILGSAMFLGPVGGAIAGAGLGIAAASEKWRDKVFGKLDEDTKKREGGLLQEFKSTLIHNVLTPLKDTAKEVGTDMKYWFQEKVMLPVADLFGPFKTATKMLFEDIIYKVSDVADSIKYTFNKFIGEPLGTFLKEKVFDKFISLTNFLTKGALGAAKFIAGAPFKLMDLTLNRVGAGMVQKRTRKRRDKYEKAMSGLYELEQRESANGKLTAREQRKYDKLRKTEARYYSDAHDEDKLNAKDNFKEIRKKRVGKIREEKAQKMSVLAQDKELHKKQRRFNAIFGSSVEYDEDLLNQYETIYKRDNGKKIKGRKNKALVKKEAAEFVKRYKEGKVKDVSVEVKDIRDNIKDNLTPIRKSLYGIQDAAHAIAQALGAKVKNKAEEINAKTYETRAKMPWNKLKQATTDIVVERTMKDVRAKEARESAIAKLNNGEDIKTKYADAFKTSNMSEERKAQLRAKYRPEEGSGGSKDPSWLMVGKGKGKKEKDKSNKDKKGGFLSSFGNTMFGALKRFDTVNDKEEAEKARKKDKKAELAEKQKSVSGKNYKALREELIARNKEAEEKHWKKTLLNAIVDIKTKTSDHTINWSDIFGKKGLITGAVLLALPKILEFIKNPAKFIKDTLSSIMNGIKISIGWLFGNNNESRTDAEGEAIVNSGLADSTTRLARNTTRAVLSNEKVQKAGKVVYKAGKEVKTIWDASKKSRAVTEILDAGVKNVDELAELTGGSIDELLALGVKNKDDLVKLGIKSKDDLAKVGFKTTDDLAKFGIDVTTSKGKKQLSSLGIKYTDELVEGGIELATNKKTVKGVIKEGASAIVSKTTKVASDVTSKTVSTVVEKGNKVLSNQFIKGITDWLTAAFTNDKVGKLMGKEAASKTLAQLTKKITSALTETVLGRFAAKISQAIAKTAGRAAGAVGTGGLITVAFGVADVISGAVNAERLFEIPPGTATVGMRTMASVLQFILGLGMVGPLIDVANEIVAEVTGISFLTIIASIGYSYITEATGGDIKLKELQGEFDADYEAYKKANNLPELSKRAYQDIVNPSMGTKIGRAAKSGVDFITGGFTDSEQIRKTLGKDKSYKVSLTDRFSQLTGNVAKGVTFGLVDGENLTRNMAQGLDNAKQWASNAWDKTKQWGSNTWDKTKELANRYNEWTANNRKATAEWAANTWDKTKDWTANAWDKTKDWTANAWDGTKKWAANTWDGTKEAIAKYNEWTANNRKAAAEWASNTWDKTKNIASDAWDKTKNVASNVWDTTKTKVTDASHAITGNMFNDDEIRKQLGLKDGVEVTIKDRLSMGAASLIENLSFGKFDSESTIKTIYGIQTKVSETATKMWDSVSSAASEAWKDAKQGTKDLLVASGKKITGMLGLYDENGEPLTLTEGVEVVKDKAVDTVKTLVDDTKTKAINLWNDTKNFASQTWTNAKQNTKDFFVKSGKQITGLLGLYDENGEPLPFTEGVQVVKDKAVDTVKNLWTDTKNKAVNLWTDTKNYASQTWTNAKQNTKNFFVASGKKITGLLGLYDENGEPLPFTEGMSTLKDNTIETVKNLWTDTKNNAVTWWTDTKNYASETWTNFKDGTVEGVKKLNDNLGTMFGLRDDEGNPVSLTEGVSLGASKFLDGMKQSFTDIKDGAAAFWDKTKKDITDGFNDLKEGIPKAMGELNKGLGRLLGFQDENGNAMSLTDAVKDGWSKTVSTANNLWTSFKTWISNGVQNLNTTAQQDIDNRNAGYGGFGGDGIPMNIGARGCGPTAMAMVASKLTGRQVDPVSMSNLATQGGFAGQYGTNGQYFKYAADKLNINAAEGKTTEQNLTKALSSGQPVILRGQSDGSAGSAFTRSGHYVVAVGQKDGKVIINDPRGANYSGAYNMKDVVSQSNVMWSFGNSMGATGKPVTNAVIGGASTDDIPGELIYKYAAMHLGKPYVWGANGPSSFDCSGLVNYAAKQAGVKLPSNRPTAAVWRTHCKTITRDQLRVGDLGFYREGGKITHVAIYAGDGQWCHAEGGNGPNGQGGKVKVNSPSYLNEFGRIPGVVGSSTAYIGNSYTGSTSTGLNSSTDALSSITGFMSKLGSSVVSSIITGQPAQFMTFDEYLASENGENGTDGTNLDYLNTPYSGETVSLGSRKTDANTLNKYLGGKLANKGATIVRVGQQYGVDPAFVASILHHESGNGTSNAIVNYNNPGGIMDWNNNWKTLKKFSSLDAGIDFTASNLKKNYLDQGLKTIPDIGSKYAPIGAANDPNGLNANWVPNVTKLYNQYSYDAGNGGFGETTFSVNDGGFGGDEYYGTQVDTSNIGTALFETEEIPTTKSYTFTDRTSRIGMGENYVQNLVHEQLKDTSGTSGVTNILEKVLDILSRIADNTGITSKNIKDAINTVMTNNTSVTTVNSVNGGNTVTKRTVDTNAQYNESEIKNRNIAQRIAKGIFV